MDVSRKGNRAVTTGQLYDRMARREQGMTTLGMLILVVFIGLFAFAAIRLTPVYLNYLKVSGVLEGVYEEFDRQAPTRAAIRTSISRRFDVESVSEITARDIEVTAQDGGFLVAAQYDHTTPFISNVYFTVRFDKTKLVRK
jgi:cell division protein FtsB